MLGGLVEKGRAHLAQAEAAELQAKEEVLVKFKELARESSDNWVQLQGPKGPFLMRKHLITRGEVPKDADDRPPTTADTIRCYLSSSRLDDADVVLLDTKDDPVALGHANAMAFCNELSRTAGLDPVYEIHEIHDCIRFYQKDTNGYRLPTHAEWKIADTLNIDDSSLLHTVVNDQVVFDLNYTESRAVGQKKPNKNGIFDLRGLAWSFVACSTTTRSGREAVLFESRGGDFRSTYDEITVEGGPRQLGAANYPCAIRLVRSVKD